MRALAMVVFFALAAIGIVYALRDNSTNGLVAASAAAVPIVTSTFEGTIDYQKNNVGVEVPYIIYQSDGAKAKALVFDDASTCVTSSGTYPCPLIADALATYYGDSLVRADGTIEAENLLVSRLTIATSSAG